MLEQEEVRRKQPRQRIHIPSKKLVAQVLARDNYTCQYCGRTEDFSIDHIIPVIKGGETTLDNLQTLCNRCNGLKHMGYLFQVGDIISFYTKYATASTRENYRAIGVIIRLLLDEKPMGAIVRVKHRDGTTKDYWKTFTHFTLLIPVNDGTH